jgi:prepilin signal peptidase PulO-like enzyme (type II secretory pathway)
VQVVLSIIAIVISAIDLRIHRIPRLISLLALFLISPWISFASLSLGLMNYLLFLCIFIMVRSGIGYGDVRLAFLIGILFGIRAPFKSFGSLILLDLLAFFVASIVLAFNPRGMKTRVAFAPALFSSLLLCTFN